MNLLEKQLLMVRTLRNSLPSESSAYFYLSPVLNSNVMIRKQNRQCVLKTKEKQQKD